MGQRGPRPLPHNVLALRGGTAYLQKRESEGAIQPDIEIPTCPRYLLPEARREWRRISPVLKDLGLISKLDRAALSLYCEEWAWLVFHEEALQRDVKLAAERQAAFFANPANKGAPWTGGDGCMVSTPNGALIYNVHWIARNKHALYVDKFLGNFGMSPSSRGRVSASSSQQLPLPGMEAPAGNGFHSL